MDICNIKPSDDFLVLIITTVFGYTRLNCDAKSFDQCAVISVGLNKHDLKRLKSNNHIISSQKVLHFNMIFYHIVDNEMNVFFVTVIFLLTSTAG